MLDDIRALPGASELLSELRRRGLKVVLASSGIASQTERLLALVGGDEKSHGWTTSDDVDASKPSPELIESAIEQVSGTHAIMVGDAVWDIAAAERAHLPSVGLLTGGFGEGELRDAGADHVFRDPSDLCAHLDEVL